MALHGASDRGVRAAICCYGGCQTRFCRDQLHGGTAPGAPGAWCGPGDTVICPSLTFVATANAIRYTGAAPVFADVTSAENCNISPESIAACLDATTKGICVVHYGGYPCDMDSIMALARRHGLYVVEDVAHAPGAGCWVTLPG